MMEKSLKAQWKMMAKTCQTLVMKMGQLHKVVKSQSIRDDPRMTTKVEILSVVVAKDISLIQLFTHI